MSAFGKRPVDNTSAAAGRVVDTSAFVNRPLTTRRHFAKDTLTTRRHSAKSVRVVSRVSRPPCESNVVFCKRSAFANRPLTTRRPFANDPLTTHRPFVNEPLTTRRHFAKVCALLVVLDVYHIKVTQCFAKVSSFCKRPVDNTSAFRHTSPSNPEKRVNPNVWWPKNPLQKAILLTTIRCFRLNRASMVSPCWRSPHAVCGSASHFAKSRCKMCRNVWLFAQCVRC